ncbi:MAG: macro domain-containing protein [Saprospiraceae bacterium]|nr:macro domain-containing protein [Saprospiraceae bacterium]
MIKEVSGDILLTGAQAIAHGVAPMDHFDTGLALSLRKDYPAMVKDFRHFCKIRHPKPGEAWMWGGAGGIRIINLLTQEPAKNHHGHPGEATLHNVNHSLRELVKIVKKEGIESLAIPKLATGYGKLDWKDVKPLIYEKLGELEIPIYIYSLYHAGEKAKE